MTESAGGGVTRITAAKNAAKSLVSILFGDAAIKDHLRIGLVPWNSKVKVALNGVTYNSALTTTQTVPALHQPADRAEPDPDLLRQQLAGAVALGAAVELARLRLPALHP
jgi:hypothetical protein